MIRNFIKWLQYSSFHGIPDLYSACKKGRKFEYMSWFFILTISILMLIYQTTQLMKQFIDGDHWVSTVDTHMESGLGNPRSRSSILGLIYIFPEFPPIAVCSLNRISIQKAEALGFDEKYFILALNLTGSFSQADYQKITRNGTLKPDL